MSASRETLQVQVDRVRSAILAKHGYPTNYRPSASARISPVEQVEQLATISAHWGITSQLPVVGGLLVLWRRALRIVLRWYINPIVEQQNAFNDAVARALNELQAENEQLRALLRQSDGDSSANNQP